MPRLRRVTCNDPGYTRRKAGRGFTYVDAYGTRVSDAEVLARLRALAIPPAWTDVWICADERGHLQAVGTDAAGRRQYLYHPSWRERRDSEKFDHMLVFARALPDIRRACAKRLTRPALDRDRVLACAVRLLDLGFFRIGTEGYAEQHIRKRRRDDAQLPVGVECPGQHDRQPAGDQQEQRQRRMPAGGRVIHIGGAHRASEELVAHRPAVDVEILRQRIAAMKDRQADEA